MERQDIGKMVKSQRERKGWSQQTLAEKAGTTKLLVLVIENDKRNYTIEQLLAVLDALGLDLKFKKQDSYNFKGVKPLQYASNDKMDYR